MIEYKKFDNGFQYIEVSNSSARAKIALQGAHMFHYERVAQRPLLWVSDASFLKPGKAIRGGIPICWPWFGMHPDKCDLPQHGFARSSNWELHSSTESSGAETEVELRLLSSADSMKLWPYAFELLLRITIGETVSLALTTRNCDNKPFTISSAFHSYFAVSDIAAVSVDKLQGKHYYDKVHDDNRTQQGVITIEGEVDRIYHDVDYPLHLNDHDRTILIDAWGSLSAVVWNPWVDNCAAMGDMEDTGYKTMLCIETANAGTDTHVVAPGEEHTLRTRYQIHS